MEVINTEVIDKIDEQVESLKDFLDNSLSTLKEKQEKGETIVQEEVDRVINESEARINEYLQKIRQKIIDTFKELYKNTLEQYTVLLTLINPPTDLGSVISWITKVIEYFFPQTKVVKLVAAMADILAKVANISNNLLAIASYQTSITIPNITIRPLNINIDPITPEDITG